MYGSWLSILWLLTGLVGSVLWMGVGFFAIRCAKVLGSWLILVGGILGLLNQVSSRMIPFLSLNSSYGSYQWVFALTGFLASTLIFAGVVLWIQRGRALQRRVAELEGIVDTLGAR